MPDPDLSPVRDPAALDLLEQRMWREIWAGAPAEAAAAHGIDLRGFGPVQATTIADVPDAGWLNLVLGATAPGAVDGGHLRSATEWADSLEVAYYVPVTPGLPASAEAEAWLENDGFERGYGWMKFVRDTAPPEAPEPAGVETVELAAGEGEAFAEIVAEGFDLPAWASALFRDLPDRPGWRCYVAVVEDRPVATGR